MRESDRAGFAFLLALSLSVFLVHFLANLFVGYGYFRDELYYMACSNRLSLGYVDQPPLSIALLKLVRLVLGDSLFAIRLLPAAQGQSYGWPCFKTGRWSVLGAFDLLLPSMISMAHSTMEGRA